MKIVAVIPARGGSKGLKKKNITLLANKPLIAYTIEIAKASKNIDRIIVSTDDEEIAKIAKEYGAEVPFIRPLELAMDETTTESVLKHAVEWLEQNENYKADIVVFFQATDFFKKTEWVDEVIGALLKDTNLDSAFIGCRVHKNYWKKENGKYIRTTPFGGYGPRQKKEPIFREDAGLGCAIRAHIIKEGKRLGDNPQLIEKDYDFFDIHNEFDLWIVDKIITEWKSK
jgi:CMP-N-acetylneuraminic acid synthetase